MKKHMLGNEKNIKSIKTANELTKSFMKSSRSETTLLKKQKKSTSVQKQKFEMSKNDQKVTIYCDNVGFIVQYSILSYGVKCQCYISDSSCKKNSKSGKMENIQTRQNIVKKKTKLDITLNKSNLAIVKGGVEHIFSLPSEPKHSYLKVMLSQNWQIQQFLVPNKKTKISDGQMLLSKQINCDEMYPLKNIIEADELRKSKLLKSDSKTKITWGNTHKDYSDVDSIDIPSQNLSFTLTKKSSETCRSFLFDSTKQIQRIAFLRKSFDQCDQTRDSQEEHTIQQKPSLDSSLPFINKPQKAVSINISLWSHQTPKKNITEPFKSGSKKQDSLIFKFHQHKSVNPATERLFK